MNSEAQVWNAGPSNDHTPENRTHEDWYEDEDCETVPVLETSTCARCPACGAIFEERDSGGGPVWVPVGNGSEGWA